MRLVFRRVVCFGLVLILCFQVAFAPRAKAVAPLVLTAVAAVGVGGLAAAVAAYFKANGVDMTMYNIASGAAAQEAMSNLIQEYLDDTRDGMDIDDYVSSIGLADKVFYKYYKGAADWVAARVQTVISALGVATIFDPILNWFVSSRGVSVQAGLVYTDSELLSPGGSKLRFYSFNFSRASYAASQNIELGLENFVAQGIYPYLRPSALTSLSAGNYYNWQNYSSINVRVRYYNIASGNSVRTRGEITGVSRDYYNASGSSGVGNLPVSNTEFYYILCRYTDGWAFERVRKSGDNYFLSLNAGGGVAPLNIFGTYYKSAGDVYASQQEDDGTNRFPSTSVPDDFQLVIPMEISNAGTVQPVPPSTDTQEDQSDAITAAILDSQALNELSLSETPSVEAEDAQPTAVPTAEPTTEPTAVPTAEPTLAPSIPEEYTPDITEIFPFCIPFDFYLLFDLFSAEPEAPHFTIPFPIPERIKIDSDGNFSGQYEYEQRVIEIDFRDKPELEAFMVIFRRGELILFVAGLALVTRKFIRW